MGLNCAWQSALNSGCNVTMCQLNLVWDEAQLLVNFLECLQRIVVCFFLQRWLRPRHTNTEHETEDWPRPDSAGVGKMPKKAHQSEKQGQTEKTHKAKHACSS